VLAWYDREGRSTPTPVPAGPYLKATVSADGARALVLAGVGGGSSDLWLADLVHGGMTRLTYNNTANPGLWLPGGERIVYPRFDADGSYSVVVRRLDGAGGDRVLYHSALPLMTCSLTPDGRTVVIADYGLRNGRLRLANVEGDPGVRDLPADGGEGTAEQAGAVSPDGRWLAYVSSRTRREEVYVRSLDGRGGRWQLSTGGGGAPYWGRDSHELFFVTTSGEVLTRVPLVERAGELTLGAPERVFEPPPGTFEPAYRDFDYDRARDRFLFTRPASGSSERREIALSIGWANRLDALLREKGGRK
jgi:Tol biopolymer transport system component